MEGRDLVAMDSVGTSDPFVVCIVGNKQKKTKTIKNTLNPKWRIGSQSEVMSLYVVIIIQRERKNNPHVPTYVARAVY